jgi:molybdopterin converting factor small subunit
MIRILYFGRFSDIGTSGETARPESVTDTNSLIAWLTEQHSAFLAEWHRPGARLAVNQAIIPELETAPIKDGDEIAFMSALSGG